MGIFIVCALLPIAGLFTAIISFSRELKLLRRSLTSYHRFVHTLCTRPETIFTSLPRQFANVPFGETTGLVVGSRPLSIRGDICPYNASIVKREPTGYHIVFRYDLIDDTSQVGFHSYVGYAELDDQFNQTEKEFVTLDTHSLSPEDPRILCAKGTHYLVFNDTEHKKRLSDRYMYMGELDVKRLTVQNVVSFNPSIQFVEKNWAPFEYINTNGESEIYFEYSLSPRKLLKIDNPQNPSVTHILSPRKLKKICWPALWGEIRGGTAAQKVGDKYLGFFHSAFQDRNNIWWYCMGAYTFEAAPPFRMTGISHYPILFEGIYMAPHMNTADPLKRVLFPCGFVVENREEGDLIHVSCGENDSNIKIVTLNKKELLKGLKRINTI